MNQLSILLTGMDQHSDTASPCSEPGFPRCRRTCVGIRYIGPSPDNKPSYRPFKRVWRDDGVHFSRPVGGAAYCRSGCGDVFGSDHGARRKGHVIPSSEASVYVGALGGGAKAGSRTAPPVQGFAGGYSQSSGSTLRMCFSDPLPESDRRLRSCSARVERSRTWSFCRLHSRLAIYLP